MTVTLVELVVMPKEKLTSLQDNNLPCLLVKVENKEPTTVEMVDGQMVVMVPKVMLLAQVVEVLLVSL